MSDTTKIMSEYDQTMIFQKAYNPKDATIAMGSFLAGKVGHAVQRSIISATIDDYSFYDGATFLYTLRITYDDSNHTNVNRAERTV